MKLFRLCMSAALLISLNSVASDSKYEIIPKVGENFFDDDSGIDDKVAYGIVINYYFTHDTGIQIGYQRTDDAKYLWYYPNTTDIQRFYINALYEPAKYGNLTPYLLAGGGYEKLSNEIGNQKSQAFFNAGVGVKYAITPVFDVVAEAKYIKKADTMDDDILTSLGVGYKFGTVSNSTFTAQNQQFTPKPIPLSDSELQSVNSSVTQEELPMPKEEKKDIFEEHKALQVSLAKKPVTETNGCKESVIKGYYVQVGAYAHSKPVRYLNSIEQKGYQATLYETSIKGKTVTKVLVGPYSSYSEARKKLKEIKSKIVNNAFIYSM